MSSRLDPRDYDLGELREAVAGTARRHGGDAAADGRDGHARLAAAVEDVLGRTSPADAHLEADDAVAGPPEPRDGGGGTTESSTSAGGDDGEKDGGSGGTASRAPTPRGVRSREWERDWQEAYERRAKGADVEAPERAPDSADGDPTNPREGVEEPTATASTGGDVASSTGGDVASSTSGDVDAGRITPTERHRHLRAGADRRPGRDVGGRWSTRAASAVDDVAASVDEVRPSVDDAVLALTPSGGQRPYLRQVPAGYAAQREVLEWLDGLVSVAGVAATGEALSYYESVGWLTTDSREHLERFLQGLTASAPTDPRSLDVADHRRSLTRIARLAHRAAE